MTASLELGHDRFKFAPYARGDFTSATLGSYSEQGASAEPLSYDRMRFDAVAATVGLRGSVDVPTNFGMVTPMARLAYRQASQSPYSQLLFYSDLGAGTASAFSQPAGSYGTTTGGVGLRARADGGLALELEYGLARGTAALQAQPIRAALRVPF
jgi:uncharacterized protein with beta-barrel porin domain